MAKDSGILVRLNSEEKEIIDKAVAKSGLRLSSWMREVLLDAAEKALVVEPQVPFDPEKGEVVVEPVVGAETGGKMRAYDPNGPEPVYEPLPGAEPMGTGALKAFDPSKGEVTRVPVADERGANPHYQRRAHHPTCPCLMCKTKS